MENPSALSKEVYKITDKINFKHSVGNINILGKMFHCNYEIFFLIRGDVEFTSNAAKKKLSPYELIIIPPGTYHQFVVLNDVQKFERCVLEFNKESLDNVNIQDCLLNKTDLQLNEDSPICQAFFRLIRYSSYRYDEYFPALLQSLFSEILINIKFEQTGSLSKDLSTKLTPLTKSILNYIDANFMQPFSLDDLAKETYTSVSTICHKFKSELNISIMQYIRQKRIILAKQLIDDGQKPSEVFDKVGYSDYSSFYRSYRAFFGKSPIQR